MIEKLYRFVVVTLDKILGSRRILWLAPTSMLIFGALVILAKAISFLVIMPTPDDTTNKSCGKLAKMASRDPLTSVFIITLNFPCAA